MGTCIKIDTKQPAWANLIEVPSDLRAQISKFLTVGDRRALYKVKRIVRSRASIIKKKGPMGYDEALAAAQHEVEFSLLEGGRFPAGLATQVAERFGIPLVDDLETFTSLVPYQKALKKPRPYQEEAIEALLAVRHGAIEHATGLGKSNIAEHIARQTGGGCVAIIVPNKNLLYQMYRALCHTFGSAKVGMFGDGKKSLDRRFLVAIARSVALVKEGSKEYKTLQKFTTIIVDESHTVPTMTMRRVCLYVMASAVNRFFLSATQINNHGLEKLLHGIIGPIVHRVSLLEGVTGGYLSMPMYRVIETTSDMPYSESADPMKQHRDHFCSNQLLHKQAADIVNLSVSKLNAKTLVLIETIEQFALLLPHLDPKLRIAFCHGQLFRESSASDDDDDDEDVVPKKESALAQLPEIYHAPDNEDLCARFDLPTDDPDAFDVLVGTSCIATGTDFQQARQIVYLVGQGAEIRLLQSLGRGTRRPEGKERFYFTDFDVVNIPLIHDQAMRRRAILNRLMGVDDGSA